MENELSIIIRVSSGAVAFFGLILLTASVEFFIPMNNLTRTFLLIFVVIITGINLVVSAYRDRLIIWLVWLVLGSGVALIIVLIPYRFLPVFFLVSLGLNKDLYDSLGRKIIVGSISEHTPIMISIAIALLLLGEENILIALPPILDAIADTIQDTEAIAGIQMTEE